MTDDVPSRADGPDDARGDAPGGGSGESKPHGDEALHQRGGAEPRYDRPPSYGQGTWSSRPTIPTRGRSAGSAAARSPAASH